MESGAETDDGQVEIELTEAAVEEMVERTLIHRAERDHIRKIESECPRSLNFEEWSRKRQEQWCYSSTDRKSKGLRFERPQGA
jgi:hypothetical protein